MQNQSLSSAPVNLVVLSRRKKWVDKEYREGYMEAAVEQYVAWQIKANRVSRGLSQDDLAKLIGSGQSAISRLEDPEYGRHSIDTLTKLANAFDCALSVKFISYSQLALDSQDLSNESLLVPTFVQEANLINGTQNEKISG